MPVSQQTFGIELEFLCLRPTTHFKTFAASPNHATVGPAIYAALLASGIPATGWEDLEIEDINQDAPSHKRWRIETDDLALSPGELEALPVGWEAESVELSSRKFYFHYEDWQSEIRAVLNVLQDLEDEHGIRFICNASTGFHVHQGFDTEKVPLTVAKRVYQVATAFERCFDELHAVNRILVPEKVERGHCYYPPSFFHQHSNLAKIKANAARRNLFDRLAEIEFVQSYRELGDMFVAVRPQLAQDQPTTGHNSAYNFDNLFAAPEFDRYEEVLTGTVELRQHAGTLDWPTIFSWIVLTTQIVQYAATAKNEEIMELCSRATDMDFGLGEVLSAMGVAEEVVDFYTDSGPMGVIGTPTSCLMAASPIDALLAQNDLESSRRSDLDAVRKAIQGKYESGQYRIDPRIGGIEIPSSLATEVLQRAIAAVRMSGMDERSEEGLSRARRLVFEWFAEEYRRQKVNPDKAKLS